MEEFKYLSNAKTFVMKVGQVISHEIGIQHYTPKEVNELKRIEVAEKILSKIHPAYLEGAEHIDKEQIKLDLALYIDDKLPRIYVKKTDYARFGGKGLKSISNKTLATFNLEIQGAEKIKNATSSLKEMTAEYVSNYKQPKTPSTASVIDAAMSSAKATVTAKDSETDVSEDNYQKLTKYLRSNSISVSKEEFVAVLRTMNDLQKTKYTKANIIKKHSANLGVPQSRISKHLKDMEFTSERVMENKNRFLQNEMIAFKQLERKMQMSTD